MGSSASQQHEQKTEKPYVYLYVQGSSLNTKHNTKCESVRGKRERPALHFRHFHTPRVCLTAVTWMPTVRMYNTKYPQARVYFATPHRLLNLLYGGFSEATGDGRVVAIVEFCKTCKVEKRKSTLYRWRKSPKRKKTDSSIILSKLFTVCLDYC